MHPHLATGLESLAATYKLKGESDKAEPLLKRALRINITIHGQIHASGYFFKLFLLLCNSEKWSHVLDG